MSYTSRIIIDPVPDMSSSRAIYTGQKKRQAAWQVVDGWFAEKDNYVYGGIGRSCIYKYSGAVVAHFTQLMWECSSFVGCAKASCSDAEVIVCNYGTLPFAGCIGV